MIRRVSTIVSRAAAEALEQRMLLFHTPVGPEFRVSSATIGDQVAPSVASDADGDFVAVWQSDGQDLSNNGIYGQRYNAAGFTVGFEFRVNTFITGNQISPAIAMDADGDFVVVWDSYGQDGSGHGIYAQRYNAVGVPQGGEFRVNTTTSSGQIAPAIAMDVDGDFAVTWTDYTQDGSGRGIFAQRYNAAGIPQGAEFRVNTFAPNDQAGSAIAMDASGNFVVAWHSFLQDGSNYG